jgi:hypothetical protein
LVGAARFKPTTEKRVIYWDAGFPGFGLDVKPTGHKSYCFQYRTKDGKSRRATIPGTLDLDAARKAAKALQGDVPATKTRCPEKRTARRTEKAASETLEKVAKQYMRMDGKDLRTAAVLGQRPQASHAYLAQGR